MLLTQEQKAERRQSIGGSDAAAAVNLSPWCSPYRLWCRYMEDDRVPEETQQPEAAHFGNVLESVVASEFSRRTGLKVQRLRRKLVHQDHAWMSAHIDRRIVSTGNGSGGRAGLECKTASMRVAHHWGDEGDMIPIQYLIQVMHYLAVTGWDEWHVAVLIGGQDFRMFKIVRDEDMICDLIMREREFWQHVLDKTPPEPVTLDDTFLRWPKDYGAPIIASPVARRAYDRAKDYRQQIAALEEKLDADELLMRNWIGEHAIMLDVDGTTPLITWKHQTSKRVDPNALRTNFPDIAKQVTRESHTRVFRYVEKKK
jgi:putative phage-type endonuclease